MPRFEGYVERECGEHRTLGGRAWCYDCSTYCYPDAPCPGCELPALRTENERYGEALRELRTKRKVSTDPDIQAAVTCKIVDRALSPDEEPLEGDATVEVPTSWPVDEKGE